MSQLPDILAYFQHSCPAPSTHYSHYHDSRDCFQWRFMYTCLHSCVTYWGVKTLEQLSDILSYFHYSCPAPHILYIYTVQFQFTGHSLGQCPVWLAVFQTTVYLSVCPSVYIHLSICSSLHLFAHHPSMYSSVCLSVFLYVCMYVCMYVYVSIWSTYHKRKLMTCLNSNEIPSAPRQVYQEEIFL